MAHDCGIPVEGELGYVPGVEGEDAERHPGEVEYTSVEDAQTYVEETGVDFLAVSIGTVHGRMQGRPSLDLDRLAQINTALRIPLVIHGGTGLSDEQFRDLIQRGVAKINYFTALSDAAAKCLDENVAHGQKGYAARLQGVREAIAAETERCIRLWGSEGMAEAVITAARPWQPVDHVILYNVQGLDTAQTHAMMAKGREMLSAIPGVRKVVTGDAVQADAQYRHAWLIRFCHEAVIESYRQHPEHVAFADNAFRPYAGGRISIDYKETV